jgi:predicted AAA+ superfamily ATPase
VKLRPHWIQRIEDAWRRRSIVWLPGVRRVGKTTLCRSLSDVEYFDCELPRVRRQLEEPETFLEDLAGRRIVLDEIHRLDRPAELLKIAADHHPRVLVVATGSSTLGASARFRDTLAGRKTVVWLTPMTNEDQQVFGGRGLGRRLLHGGLPPFYLASEPPESEFQEWMDAFWAKDIQELFRLEKRRSFQRFVELLLVASGGIFEATRFARDCEVSRTTISNYLGVLEATFVAHVVRPFSSRRATEIIAAPRVYGFDTGFVAYYRGWGELRAEDHGNLWEHIVLNEIHAARQVRDVRYWRDKQGHEIDFVLPGRRGAPLAIECKWKAAAFDPANLLVFRKRYAQGANLVVASDVDRPYTRTYRGVKVRHVSVGGLIDEFHGDAPAA